MHILILNWRDPQNPLSGGAEIVTMEHAKRWVLAGNTVTWFTSKYKGGLKNDIVDGVHVIRHGSSISVFFYAFLFYIFLGKQFDVIIDEVHGIPFFTRLYVKKPIIVFIHEIADDIWDFMYSFPINKIGKLLENLYFRLYRNCLFWTDAQSTIEELQKRDIPRSQSVAIACPIYLENSMSKPKKIPKELSPTYIFVSRVVRMKGIEEVIKAFSFIAREQKNARLWIVGDGDKKYVQRLQNMLHEYGITRETMFWGKVTDKKKYYLMARAHILLHGSVKEGWGLVVLEAAYVCTPSVVYNVLGLRDVVQHDKTGVVVSSNSPQEMAREAMKLVGNTKKYHEFQKNGKQWVENITWEDVSKQSIALLHKALSTSITIV